MFAIIGAAGNVGFATAQALREAGMQVRAILRDEAKAERLTGIGCEIAVADLQDAEALAKAIGNADVVQVILPVPSLDKDATTQMRSATESLATALEEARPKRILAISDYGAHVARDIGMPTIFRVFEERLSQLDCQKVFLRSAEHMQGWGRVAAVAKATNTLPSFHDPVDIVFPTVSAPDVGLVAAELLLQPAQKRLEVVHVEGPHRYGAKDVANVVSELLRRTIEVVPVPRSHWEEAFLRVTSPSLAELLIKANDAQNGGRLVDVEQDGKVCRGTTQLIEALRPFFIDE